jgi:hypothetical protein
MQIGHFSERTEPDLQMLLANEGDDKALGVDADVAEGEAAGAAKLA